MCFSGLVFCLKNRELFPGEDGFFKEYMVYLIDL